MEKVRIIWNGMGGELDSVTVDAVGERTVAHALIEMIGRNIVSPGDSFIVREVE